jgi:SAM-dependent methyltransferase
LFNNDASPSEPDAGHKESYEMNAPVDLAAVKGRQQLAWASGDYAVVGTTLQIVGESLAEACDLRWDEDVLDVAAGNGNATLAAARRGARVTSTDYVSTLLDRGALRAQAEGRRRQVSDRRRRSAAVRERELRCGVVDVRRDVRPRSRRGRLRDGAGLPSGGRIGLANWTPGGFIGQMFKTLGRHLPPPAGRAAPSAVGRGSASQTLFGDKAAAIVATPKMFNFRYRSAAHFIEVFKTWYGPVLKAYAALPSDKGAELTRELTELLNGMNRGGSRSLLVPSEYLEVVITRK